MSSSETCDRGICSVVNCDGVYEDRTVGICICLFLGLISSGFNVIVTCGWFGPKNCFTGSISCGIVLYTCIITKARLGAWGDQLVADSFVKNHQYREWWWFCTCTFPWRVCVSESQRYSIFCVAFDDVSVVKGWFVIVTHFLKNSVDEDQLFLCSYGSLCVSVFNKVDTDESWKVVD